MSDFDELLKSMNEVEKEHTEDPVRGRSAAQVDMSKYPGGPPTNEDRKSDREAYQQAAMSRVQSEPEPEGQKFPVGSRVRIADDLGRSMYHFPSGVDATVMYTYAHAYGTHQPDDAKTYSLDVDGRGSHAWYRENQLTAI